MNGCPSGARWEKMAEGLRAIPQGIMWARLQNEPKPVSQGSVLREWSQGKRLIEKPRQAVYSDQRED